VRSVKNLLRQPGRADFRAAAIAGRNLPRDRENRPKLPSS
jgi:hypothetical protein